MLFVFMAGLVSAFVRINEIMYDPSPSQGSDSFSEWIEIFNNGTTSVDLTNATLCGDSLLKGFINRSDGNIYSNTTFVLEPSKFALITDGSSGTEVYDNFSVDSSALAFHVSGATMCSSGLSDGEEINITSNTDSHIVNYTQFATLFPDTNDQGKTLIFYKGNFTESAFFNGTPGDGNDQFAPDFNKWINPSQNNSNVSGLFNVTVNVTDVTNVSSVLIEFSGTNSSMQQGNDIWHFVLNTSQFSDGLHNLTAYFNDTGGFSNADTLLNVTVDNTAPSFSNIDSSPAVVFNNLSVTISTVWSDVTTSVTTVVFEHNATGMLKNFTVTSLANNNFSLVINNTILENQEVVGWKSYGTDSLGNINNNMAVQTFAVINRAPTLSSDVQNITWLEDTVNSSINLSIHFTDDDLDTLTFNSTTPPDINVFINQSTGIVTLTPSGNFNGTNFINFTASDGTNSTKSNEVILTVSNVNDAPVLGSVGSLTASINVLFFFDVNSTDVDTGDSSIFSSNSTLFTINSSTGIISFTPNSSQVGSKTINISVSDGAGLQDNEIILFTVGNTAPQITSFSPADNKTIASDVGSQDFNITFTDSDESDSPVAAWFRNGTSIAPSNASNVTVTGLSTGIYNITVTVTDSASTSVRNEWTLTVSGNISGNGLTSPVLDLNETERQSVTNVTINQSTFGGIDFGSNTLNFSGVINLEDVFNISNGLISVDTDTFPGLNKSATLSMKGLNFTKAPLIFTSSGFKSTADNASCPSSLCSNITYDVANGILRFDVAHFTTFFAVTNTTNGAPSITSNTVTSATKNQQYTYDVDATDPDGDTLTFSLTTAPTGMSIGSSSGLITFTPTSLGNFSVAVQVSDGSLTDSQSYNLIVGEGAKLRITDLDVKVDGKTKKNLNNNTKIKRDAEPGSEIQFIIEIENFFTNDEDLEIEDIEVEITIEDIDDGDDLEEDADEFDLKAGKDEKVKIKFDVPLEVDEGTFDVIIDVEGEDENGTTHEIRFELELDVEKEKHEIRILRASLTPTTIKCQRTVSINTELINTGTEDEDEVTLEVINQELGIKSITIRELDEGTDDNRLNKLVTASINNDVMPGIYPITINAYYDSKLAESRILDLDVLECELVREVKKGVREAKPKVEVITPEPKVEEKPKAPIEISFVDSDEYLTLLAILVVIFIGTAIFVVGAAFIILRK